MAGAFYDVMAHGNQREHIFRNEADRLLFYQTPGEAHERTGWRVQAWVLMSNHHHLMVETPEATWWRECDGCRTPIPAGIRSVD
jgi:putative transposase